MPLAGNNPKNSRYMFFKNELLVNLMSDYFDAAWDLAIVLKDYDGVQWDSLMDIAHRLESDIFDNVPGQDQN